MTRRPEPGARSPKEDDEDFLRTLDLHGFGFQYAVSNYISQKLGLHWTVEDEETPVQCNGRATRIDLVLRHATNRTLRIVGECKRAEKRHWYFVRTPFRRKQGQVFFEDVLAKTHQDGSPYVVRTSLVFDTPAPAHPLRWPSGEPYGLAFPKGTRGNPSPLKDAIAQVFRGTNGLIDRFASVARPGPPMDERAGMIVPVIFTTAILRCSEADLPTADLRTGKVQRAPLHSKPWLWLRQNMSPDLKHSAEHRGDTPQTLAEWTLQEYSRCLAVVSVAGIDEFLTHHSWKD